MTVKEYIREYHNQLNDCRNKLKKLNDEFAKSNTAYVNVGDIISRNRFTILVDNIVAITNTDYVDDYGDYWSEDLLTKEFDDYDDFPEPMFIGVQCKKDGTITSKEKLLICGESNLKIFRKNAAGVYVHFKTTDGRDIRKHLTGRL